MTADDALSMIDQCEFGLGGPKLLAAEVRLLRKENERLRQRLLDAHQHFKAAYDATLTNKPWTETFQTFVGLEQALLGAVATKLPGASE